MGHRFWPPNLQVASALTGALTNRVVLVSRRPGFRFWVFFILVWVGYVLGDDHSLMGGSDDAWTWWIVGLFGCPASCCVSCVRAPWTWGLFVCFSALFSLLNVEEVYNDTLPVLIVILLTSNSAQ